MAELHRILRRSCDVRIVVSSANRLRILVASGGWLLTGPRKRYFAFRYPAQEMANSVVFPVQLLFAVLSIDDEARDDLLDQLGVKLGRLS
jgi:hypothetical protein